MLVFLFISLFVLHFQTNAAKVQATCEDLMKCRVKLSKMCKDEQEQIIIEKTMKCSNVTGSYRCDCITSDMQGNGIDTCGYVTTLKQTLYMPRRNLTDYQQGITKENMEIASMQGILKSWYKQMSSLGELKIKTLRRKQKNDTFYEIIYDVYSFLDGFYPITFREFFREYSMRKKQKKLFQGYGDPTQGPAECTPTVLGNWKNHFRFTSGSTGSISYSEDKCPDGRSMAYVECKQRAYKDGSFGAYFDHRTLTEIDCNSVPTTASWSPSAPTETTASESSGSGLTTSPKKHENLVTYLTQTEKDNARESNFTGSLQSAIDLIQNSSVMIPRQDLKNILSNLSKELKNFQVNSLSRYGKNEDKLSDVPTQLDLIFSRVELQPKEVFNFESDTMVLEIVKVSSPGNGSTAMKSGITFDSDETKRTKYGIKRPETTFDQSVKAHVSFDAIDQAQKKNPNSSMSVSFLVYKDTRFLQSKRKGPKIHSKVLSISLADTKIKDLKEPLWFVIPPVKEDFVRRKDQLRFYQCAYLDVESKTWRTDGCKYKRISTSPTPNCTCDHLTNFALLVKTKHIMSEHALDIFGKIGCSLSIVGLTWMLLVNLYFPSLRKSQTNQIHCHLSLCLLISYLIFVTSVEKSGRGHGSCIFVAATLQFFLLAAWGWMVTESVTMYKKLVTVFGHTGSRYVLKASVMVYLSAGAVVGASLILSVAWYDKIENANWMISDNETSSIPSSYISERLCWLHSYSLFIGFLVPVGLGFAMNVFGFVAITNAITCGRKKLKETCVKTEMKNYLIRASITAVLLGLSWGFAIPLSVTDDPTSNKVFGWLFSITNGLQGFFIFLLFCVRRKDVRELWWGALKKFICGPTVDSSSLSTTPRRSTNTKETDISINAAKITAA